MEVNDPHGGHGRVCEGDRTCVGVSHGLVEDKLLHILKTSHTSYLHAYEDGTDRAFQNVGI